MHAELIVLLFPIHDYSLSGDNYESYFNEDFIVQAEGDKGLNMLNYESDNKNEVSVESNHEDEVTRRYETVEALNFV